MEGAATERGEHFKMPSAKRVRVRTNRRPPRSFLRQIEGQDREISRNRSVLHPIFFDLFLARGSFSPGYWLFKSVTSMTTAL